VFDGMLTTDTFVMGWHREADRLVFDVEASLWPGQPDYEPPRPGEWACYKPARIVFDGVESVSGLPDMASAPRSMDADGSQDFGSLNELAAEAGGYLIAGDFGQVRVRAAAVRLDVGSRAEPSAAPDGD
jgi:hypothetical protein